MFTRYPQRIEGVDFKEICQCQSEKYQHSISFDGNYNDNVGGTERCTVDCIHYMFAAARTCQYKNSIQGLILYRGSKVQYSTAG